jgi:hypothetical protein
VAASEPRAITTRQARQLVRFSISPPHVDISTFGMMVH